MADGTDGTIFTWGVPVSDITGFKLDLLLNYRDQQSDVVRDHPPGDAPLSSGLGFIWTAATAPGTFSLSEPLSQLFNELWSQKKDKSGQTMLDHAVATARQGIQSAGGSDITGSGFPTTGHLRTIWVSDNRDETNGVLVLSYWLPGASFGFSKSGGAWTLTFRR
jgi:hypothetical protein